MSAAPSTGLRHILAECQRNSTGQRFVHPLSTFMHVLGMTASVWTWYNGCWPLTLVCVAVCAHVGHSKLIAFHEAAHGTLNPRRWVNEVQGIILGTAILVPLSVYRYVHAQHHAYLGTEQDLEMWPFVDTRVPRWGRILAAVGELLFGFFYTPVLFLRGIFVARFIPREQQRRIAWEYCFCLVTWWAVLTVIHRYDWWEPFIVGYLLQAVIAGNLQSVRKFTEHVGLTGDTLLTKTRTVVDERSWGRFLSATMLHIDYHGTHHRFAKVPYYHLVRMTPYVYDGRAPHVPIYPTYTSAMLEMIRSLADPRVGAQWMR